MLTEQRPEWLKAPLPRGPLFEEVRENVEEHDLHTVCQSAQCPNMGECWSRGTATLMILGNVCTRACSFCAIQTGRPSELDMGEPARVAESVRKMGLKHCVITSVARDDLRDGGASVWAATIRAIRHKNPETAVEVLTADFRGKAEYLDLVLDAEPDIFNHNLETVERLQRPIRKTARYQRSLWCLEHASQRGFVAKSGLMLGIGERPEEVEQTLRDIRAAGARILTIGQYLSPSPKHAPVDRWVTPEEFAHWKEVGHSIGFDFVESGPLVRSSYRADEQSAAFSARRQDRPAAQSA
jgi:lipoic acid synthetase